MSIDYSKLTNLIPTMTSPTTPSGIASASSQYDANRPAWKAFNKTIASYNDCWASTYADTLTAWISYDWGKEVRFNLISLQPYTALDVSIVEFDLEYWSDGDWIKEGRYKIDVFTKGTDVRYVKTNTVIKTTKFRLNNLIRQGGGNGGGVGASEIGVYLYLEKKTLLKSNNKFYSLKPTEIKHETKMTSNTTPAPLVASASSQYDSTLLPFRAFNGINSDANSWATASNSPTGHIQIDFGSQKLANIVYVTNRNNTDFATTSPKDFNILGSNDNVNFTKIAEIKNQTNWTKNQTRRFNIAKPNKYRYYRLEISTNNGATYTAIGEILYGLESGITELPLVNVKNFTNYGTDIVGNINTFFVNKNYILQDTISEDVDGLWKTQINRKPLSIRFD